MSKKMIVSSFLVLAIWSLVASAEIDSIIACLDNDLSVQLDSQTVNYYGVETYFKYNKNNVVVHKNPKLNYAKLILNNASIIFRGKHCHILRGDATVQPKEYNVSKETIIKVNTEGSVAHLDETEDCYSLSSCSIAVTRNSADTSTLPDNLIKKVLSKASICLSLQLCSALGTVKVMLNPPITSIKGRFLLLAKRYIDRLKNFKVYWNVPTIQCYKYGINFQEVSQEFNIIQNHRDQYRGDKIVIMYDPGNFPALLKDKEGNLIRRNGGVPQEGNLTLHLEAFRRVLDMQIPDQDFSGLGVIDFEHWRPIFRQNWASMKDYRDYSITLEQDRNPRRKKAKVERMGTIRFERAGRHFMEETMQLAKNLRPKASWGYYGYPLCLNWRSTHQSDQCMLGIIKDNNKMSWLFNNETLILPSVYLPRNLTHRQEIGLVRGRIEEAARLANKSPNKNKARVLAYHCYKHQDQSDEFLEMNVLVDTIIEVAASGGDGIIIWGSSNDFNSQDKCERFQIYLRETLGPAVLKAKEVVKELYNQLLTKYKILLM